jgi:hypothetical protein
LDRCLAEFPEKLTHLINRGCGQNGHGPFFFLDVGIAGGSIEAAAQFYSINNAALTERPSDKNPPE